MIHTLLQTFTAWRYARRIRGAFHYRRVVLPAKVGALAKLPLRWERWR